jgi:nucleoside recognition membrane protein YjiH
MLMNYDYTIFLVHLSEMVLVHFSRLLNYFLISRFILIFLSQSYCSIFEYSFPNYYNFCLKYDHLSIFHFYDFGNIIIK